MSDESQDASETAPNSGNRVAQWLLVLSALAAVAFAAYQVNGGGQGPGQPEPRLAAIPAAAALPRPSTRLNRIAFGSCLHQARPQPIIDDLMAASPQLTLMLGDNVYGDFKSSDAAELRAAYEQQAKHPQFGKARRLLPMLATWDDHDYGLNDGGREFAHRVAAARLFHAFWNKPPERPLDQGIHYSRIFGPAGQRVQIIMLDTRSFRSPLERKSEAFPHWGKYEPSDDPQQTILGDDQWRWLQAELRKPAEIRLIASSIQVLAEGHGWERWGNLPKERERLLSLTDTASGGVIFLSGDRHAGAVYVTRRGGRQLVEATSSSLNLKPRGPNRDTALAPLESATIIDENFGMIAIDWSVRQVELSLNGLGGKRLLTRSLAFGDLGIGG